MANGNATGISWAATLFAVLLTAATACVSAAPSFAQASGRTVTADSARTSCLRGAAEFRECRVSEFGELGRVGAETYFYAMYCVVPDYAEGTGKCGDTSFVARYHAARGSAVFARSEGASTLNVLFERVGAEIALHRYDKPELVRRGVDTILYLPIALDGTGNYNQSEYYLRTAGRWQRIEAMEWLTDLARRLPANREIWKGVWPDVRTMRAEAGLYRRGDGNCCPTGGVARMTLAIRGGRFVIDSIVVDTVARERTPQR